MYYWPPFVTSIKEDELVGVVAHEVSHCSYKHMTRRGNRHPGLWNCAGDFVINWDLKEAGFTLPYKPSHTVPKDSDEHVHLLDPKYKGMSTEEVYERLMQEATSKKGKGGSPGGGPGDGEIIIDVAGCGGVIDAAKPHDKLGADQIDSEWEANVRMAIAVATASAGKLPGHLERLAKGLKQPKISWRDKTKRFIDNSMIKDYSYARPNRRSFAAGVILPGMISDRMHKLVGFVDTSGSVSREMQVEMVSELGGALDEGVADELIIVYADDGVQHVDHYTAGDLVQVTATSGGGTDFTESFKWLRENEPDASCVIYLTDMQTCGWGEEPPCPVMWACYTHESMFEQVAKSAPFGESILIPK
jgi:predicted metal-dependent peptidase